MPVITNHSHTKAPRLIKALDICVLLIISVTALAYPLCLPDSVTSQIYRLLPHNHLFRELNAWMSCGISPLVLKESMLLTLVAALVFIFSWIKIRSQYLGQEQSALNIGEFRLKAWVVKPELWVLVLMLYYAMTIAWSEVFRQGLQTWVLMAAGIAILVIVRSQGGRRAYAVKFMLLCVLCGAMLAGLALLQHLDRASFLPQSADPRNRMSSLIGHNTGLSSWLMFPLSFSLYFSIVNHRLWARLTAALLGLLFIGVIIAAESRAIWLLGLIICILLPCKIIRLHRKCLPVAGILVMMTALLAVILGLTVSPQTNPLARLPVSLTERATEDIFNLDQLRRETRLRILVVTMTELFPQNPVFGSGLGSFSWEYPRAQGRYFASHPETWIGTTTRRTDLAHNDYLQILAETGLVGLGLLLGAICALGRESMLSYRKLPESRDRALWWSLTIPGTAVALHALVDFPFHVAPIAVITLTSISLSTRLVNPPNPILTHLLATPSNQICRRATFVGLLATLLIFAWLPWGWQALVGRVFVSDIYYNAGVGWLNAYYRSENQSEQKRLELLNRSDRSFREAIVNNVFNGQAYEGQATACINRGNFLLHAIEIGPDGRSAKAEGAELAMKMSISRDAQLATSVTENQLHSGGLRYHYTWYLLGRAWRLQWELEKDSVLPKNSHALREAIAALRKAAWYNPADHTAAQELSELLSWEDHPDSAPVTD